MAETFSVGVTGAAGYIGSAVARALLAAGHDVIPVDNFYAPQVRSIDGLDIDDVDVRDRNALETALADVDVLMHLGALSGVQECEENADLAFDVNVGGTENVAWLCRREGIPLAFPASMAIIGDPVEFPITAEHPRNPLNLYGLTKVMSEADIEQLAAGRFPAVVFMKSNLYGHHEVSGASVGKRTVINIFVERALTGAPLTVHEPGTQSRDFIHVADVAAAYEAVLDYLVDRAAGAETVPIASGEAMSVLEIAELVQRIIEEERGEHVPVELVENPRSADETIVEDFDVDTDAARDRFGFECAHSVEESVREMVRSADG